MKTINIYSFDELSKEAKQSAIEYQRQRQDFFWADESVESLEAFAELIGLDIPSWEIDWLNPRLSNIQYDDTHLKKDLNIPMDTELTGYCLDYTLFREWNYTKSVKETLEKFLWICCADYEEQLTDDSIGDYLMSNSYQFLEDGRIY